ncbi:MAG: ACT domain-containing protein [Lentisphaeria bacterium]|nr:ACT domain-containing protein [Lentisphaeria bacterium]MBQ8755387.1 ACT domain-containing protein [Lentisphaeria bacterium]MBQ9775004.1 ACT domain-containing protein [Lentisphaeria bacterium]
MLVKQLSLFIENRPGTLSSVCKVLKDNNLNIRTLSLADTQKFGILRLLLPEHAKAKEVLEKAGFVVNEADVLALKVPDYAGGLADLLSIIDKYELQVEYMYAFATGKDNSAVNVFRFENPEEAIAKLKNEPVTIFTTGELFA